MSDTEEEPAVGQVSSIFPADDPSEEIVLETAVLSAAIYNLRDTPEVPGYTKFFHHEESPSEYRVAHWCMFVSEDGTKLFIVFRGSQTVMDWLQNFSFSPAFHPQYNENIKIHSGYFHEVDSEYKTLKEKLNELFAVYDKLKLTKVVITGHSKGGGLAQMLTDKIFNDTEFQAAFPTVCSTLSCVTFSAPMIFWFTSPEFLPDVRSAFLFHNFIIRRDPVPVLQMMVSEYKQNLYRMVDSEVSKHTVFAGVAVTALRINELVNALEPYVKGFLPVGSIHVANITQLGDTFGVQFEAAQYDVTNLKEWICVREKYFGFDYHGIVNHVGVAQNCLKERLARQTGEPESDKRDKTYGLYVQNNTYTDVLFVMSYMMTPVYWARVPHHKTVHVGKSKFFYHVRVCRYEERYVPTPAGQVGQFGIGISAVAPAVAIGSALLSKGRDNLSNTWCDGRTAEINKIFKDGKETKKFEIVLKK